jgi:hypothetical protein
LAHLLAEMSDFDKECDKGPQVLPQLLAEMSDFDKECDKGPQVWRQKRHL